MAAPANPVAELLARLPVSPEVYPQKLDLVRGAVLLLGLDAGAYRAASFLDDRILSPEIRGAWIHGAQASEAAAQVRDGRPLHFIFHAGHTGSTLVSRLLDDAGGVLGLREPLPLRTLAEAHDVLALPESLLSAAQFAGALGTFLRFWSRGWPDTRAVVVKATSTTARIAPQVLAAAPAARAIHLHLRAEPYLATLLSGANSALDLRGHAAERIRRVGLRTRAPLGALHGYTLGEFAALAWLAEALSAREAAAAHPGRVLAVDFDAFLADTGAAMRAIVRHFGIAVDAGWLERVPANPALTRYSKAPEHAYGPEVRAQLLADARREHAPELRRGLAWLEGIARADAALAPLIGAGLNAGLAGG